jgi:hypothetical protein
VRPATLKLILFLALSPVLNNWQFVDIFETGIQLEGGKVQKCVLVCL